MNERDMQTMNDQDLVNALREHAEWAQANEWETPITLGDDLTEAADVIEKLQGDLIQRNADLLKAREDLQGAKNASDQHAAINDTLYDSNMKLASDRKALINELCQYCGKYKYAHEGACDGCRWKEELTGGEKEMHHET